MTTQLSPLPVQRFFDNNNNPLSGGQLWTYAAGTSTPQATYTDSTGGTPNANPLILNARGEGNVWLTPGQAYKFVLKDASSNTIWTVDQITLPGTPNYTAAATGSVTRTITSKLGDFLTLKDFGALGDGSTDDTVAIQSAISWCAAQKVALYATKGTYLYSGVSVSSGQSLTLIGESSANVAFSLTSATAVGINCTTDLPIVISGITFNYKTGITGSAGSFISIPGDTAGNKLSRFIQCTMQAPWIGFNLTGASGWMINGVTINGHLNVGINIANSFVADAGDSNIINCELNTTSTTAITVLQASSGGLRICNNKMIGGATAYQLALAVGAVTSDLLINGNSIEAQSGASISIRRAGASGTFHNIVVSSNQFAGAPGVLTVTDLTAGWLGGISIIGNVASITAGGTPYNFNVGDSITLEGNTSTGTGIENGVSIAAACTNVRVGINCWTSFATPVNNSSNSTTIAKKVYQTTTSGITCSTAYGSLFAGNVSVSFPSGFFQLAPVVTATAISGTSAVSAVVSGVSGSGCTATAVCFTSGSVVTVYLRAEADY